jgi:hypothetical protein
MKRAHHSRPRRETARTVRFPDRLRARIAEDAERCGRSFESQVIALLRRHYGEDVDIAPSPDAILAMARASVAELPPADRAAIERRLMRENGE